MASKKASTEVLAMRGHAASDKARRPSPGTAKNAAREKGKSQEGRNRRYRALQNLR